MEKKNGYTNGKKEKGEESMCVGHPKTNFSGEMGDVRTLLTTCVKYPDCVTFKIPSRMSAT